MNDREPDSGRKIYLVEWVREGIGKKSKFYRTERGYMRFWGALFGNSPDPGEVICCYGRDCGCEGETWGDRYENVPAMVWARVRVVPEAAFEEISRFEP